MENFDGLMWVSALWRRGCLGKLLAVALSVIFAVSAVVVGAVVVFALWGEQVDSLVVVESGAALPTATVVAIPTPGVKERSATVRYEDLARNTESYVGRTLYYRGQVAQVLEGGGGVYVLRVAVTPGDLGLWDDYVYVHYRGDLRLLENDIVDFWLEVDGRVTYEALLGNQITIPEATALVAEIAKEPTVVGQATGQPQENGAGSRSNPVPANSSHLAADGMQVRVVSVDYDAWPEIKAGNPYYSPPAVGNWFTGVRVEVVNVEGSDSEAAYVYDGQFSLVGDAGIAYTGSCVGEPDELNASLYRGGSAVGNVCKEVRGGDGNLLLVYAESFDSSVYFALPVGGQ